MNLIAVPAPVIDAPDRLKEHCMRVISAVALSLALAAPALAAGDKLPPDRPPSEMTPTEIKAYNADITASHPYYIKCRKTEVIGSLAKKLRVCRTNEQWKESAARGNDTAREAVEAMSKAPINSN
jgi:hypothetical protein